VSSSTRTTNKQERRGEVLEVARELLADGRSEDLLSLVTQLVEQNHQLTTRAAELEKQLERIQARYKRLQRSHKPVRAYHDVGECQPATIARLCRRWANLTVRISPTSSA
jgi:DNA repair ATPase RecN